MNTNVTPNVDLNDENVLLDDIPDAGANSESSAAIGEPVPETHKWTASLQNSLNWVGTALRHSALAFNNVAASPLSDSRITYAAYILRAAGLLVAAFGVFSPIIESGLLGIIGWLVDLLINVIAGVVLFMIAEIALTTREISETLKFAADKNIVEQRVDASEPRSEGY